MKKETVELLDDTNGRPATETVEFAIDRVDYTIDLSTKNATQLRRDMQPWCDAASQKRKRAGRPKTKTVAWPKAIGNGNGKANGHTESKPRRLGVSTEEVRAWLKENGHPVADRGRISAGSRKLFAAAHRRKTVNA
jgi:hypothetical protein